MSEQADGTRAPLDHTRQVTIDALCEHFANDVMSVETPASTAAWNGRK